VVTNVVDTSANPLLGHHVANLFAKAGESLPGPILECGGTLGGKNRVDGASHLVKGKGSDEGHSAS